MQGKVLYLKVLKRIELQACVFVHVCVLIPFDSLAGDEASLLTRSCSSQPHTAVYPHTWTTTGSQTGLKNTPTPKSTSIKWVNESSPKEARLTVVIHAAVFVEDSQVETLAEPVAIPYLDPKTSASTVCGTPSTAGLPAHLQELVVTFFPDNRPQAVDRRKSAE